MTTKELSCWLYVGCPWIAQRRRIVLHRGIKDSIILGWNKNSGWSQMQKSPWHTTQDFPKFRVAEPTYSAPYRDHLKLVPGLRRGSYWMYPISLIREISVCLKVPPVPLSIRCCITRIYACTPSFKKVVNEAHDSKTKSSSEKTLEHWISKWVVSKESTVIGGVKKQQINWAEDNEDRYPVDESTFVIESPCRYK